ncbi:TetR/AcrR family transcriptional regulator [Christensenellaceae bacterium OttesenSCG-928-M15]|nr:TetR/AcrR family transcriptional regulator [Christensenellaceae bacterium OttesenSCG-928-M15]
MDKNLKKNINDTRRGKILLTAARLFIEQGYDKTGMRQIAEEAGVSLSLTNYHFGSKRELGVRLIQGHLRALQPYVKTYTEEDERLFAATLLRLNYNLMNRPALKQFYEDTLLNDIYLEALTTGNVERDKQRSLSTAQMFWVLSDSYIPASIERAMVVCPFSDMIGMDVPDFIIRYFMYHVSSGEKVLHEPEWYVTKSRELGVAILEDHPHLYNILQDIPKNVAQYV